MTEYKNIIDKKLLLHKRDQMLTSLKDSLSYDIEIENDERRKYVQKNFEHTYNSAKELYNSKDNSKENDDYNKEVEKFKKDYMSILKKYDDDVLLDPRQTLFVHTNSFGSSLHILRTCEYDKVCNDINKILQKSFSFSSKNLTMNQLKQMNISNIRFSGNVH